MKFVVIDPTACTVEFKDAREPAELYAAAGLSPHEVDHGCVFRHEDGWSINVICYEHGMFVPVEQGRYFSIGGQLFQGGVILYAADERGETIDLHAKPPVVFYRGRDQIELAIETGQVVRPMLAVNGEVIWQWPEPRVGSEP
jgi:hypothetical protein